jgi:transposase
MAYARRHDEEKISHRFVRYRMGVPRASPSDSQKQGRPKDHSPREILDALFYVLKSGCPWRLLPRDFPSWKTVYHYFREWRLDGS